MGGQQSKEECLYQQAIQGNFTSLAALRNQGANLEWIDEQVNTALIVACSRQDLLKVAETLIELGSKVDAYSRGSGGGTPLHIAVKSGLLETVKLLLSSGANLFIRNDNGQTPLDVAIEEGKADIIRAIEGYMCIFSGWLREFYGPGLLEVVATSWVVIVPSGHYFPLELTVYANLLNTKPSKVIDLRRADIEEPNFQGPDPSLIIYDKANKTRYKFASGNPGDRQQIQWLYNACRGIHEITNGIHQVVSSHVQRNTQTSAPYGNQVVAENVTLVEDNGWGNARHDSTQNGWGSLVGPTTSKLTNGWIVETPKEEYNGWGLAGLPATTESSNNGWGDEPLKEEYKGWGLTGGPVTTESSNSGWGEERCKEECKGWGSLSKPTTSAVITTTKVIPNELPNAVASSIPSAPILPDEDFNDDEIQNLGPRYEASVDTCTDNPSSSSCVICWEMRAEAACVPCGHMAACMPCLNEVKSNNGNCPVCRAKIDQVLRIYDAGV